MVQTTHRPGSRPAASDKPRPMRIALISVHGDPLMPIGAEEAGGQNVYVLEVARALTRLGHSVDVYTRGRAHDRVEVIPHGGGRVIRLPAGPRGFVPRRDLFGHLPEFLQNMRSFVRHDGARYGAIHSNYWLSGWVAREWAKERGVAHLHTHHSLGAVKFEAMGRIPAHGHMRLAVEAALIERCEAVIATSPEDVMSMERHYGTPGNAVIVPCGVDQKEFRPREPDREALGIPDDGALLAYVGRFDPNKGIETFVRSAAIAHEAHPVRLVFAGGFEPGAGDSDEHSRIRSLVEELGLSERAHFLGRVERERLPEVYAAADVCVVPSRYESFGLVAVEAMGCGTPVVASETGGLRYSIVHRETGLLAPPGDHEAFASAIGLLLDDPALRASMGLAASRLVGRMFTWSAVARRLESVYASFVPSVQGAGASA